jgi:hypothetical protein
MRSLPAFTALAVFLMLPLSAAHAAVWSEHELVGINDSYDDLAPEIAVDPSGRPWIIWMGVDNQGVTDYEIYCSRWGEGAGWSARQRIYADNAQYDAWPRIAMAEDGTPWVVWLRKQPNVRRYDLLSSRFVGGHGRCRTRWWRRRGCRKRTTTAWLRSTAGVAGWCSIRGTV